MTLRDTVSTISKLHSDKSLSEDELKLLKAIALSVGFDEPEHNAFIKTGFEIAVSIYECGTMNMEYEETEKDPDNPKNWEIYQKYKEITQP